MYIRKRPPRARSHSGSWLWWLVVAAFAGLLILASTSPTLGTTVSSTEQPEQIPTAPRRRNSALGAPTPAAKNTPPAPPAVNPASGPLTITGSDAAGQPTRFQLPTGAASLNSGGVGVSPQDWEAGFTEGFEGDFPGDTWEILDGSDDGLDRTWGLDDFRVNSGNASVWVAAGEADGLDPEFSFYPDDLDSWMIVGPFDLQNAQAADVEFHMWRDTEPEFDWIFVGASTDGATFDGEYWSGDSGGWQYYDVGLGPYVGLSEVWLAWYFHSDESNPEADYEGVWVDDVTLWVYTESGPPETTNLIENYDFETGDLTGWSSAGSTAVSSQNAYSGSYSAWLGGINDASDELYQTFDVPAEVNGARIRFRFELAGEETEFDADFVCAGVHRASDDELLIDLGCLDGTDVSHGWSQVDYVLSGPELLTVAGETVYIDFFLETDGDLPTSLWVDNVAFLVRTGGTAGDSHEGNDAPSTATQLEFDAPITDLTIDPAGDYDYFAFEGSSGQTVAIDVDAAINGSSLDSYLWLMDSDGATVLAENDDDGNTFDSYLTYTLPADGTYYAVVSSYDGDGDRSFVYAISLTADSGPPPTPPPTPTPPPASNQKAWTAILYLAGDTNLWREYQPYVQGLERLIADKSDFLNVLVLLDLPAEAPISRTVRLDVQPDGNYTNGVNRWDMGELNMGDPRNLVNFVKWAAQNYPADHYYLAIDDHGNSVAGIAWDDTSNGDNLTPPELYAALKEITNNGARQIDVLDWEACLMQTFEGAYDVRNFANFLFGFESVSYGGNTYPRYFQNLTASTTPAQFVQSTLEAYFQDRTGAVVGSVVNLSQVGAVRTAVDSLADALLAQVGTQKDAMTAARNASQKFDVGDDFKITNDDYYLDLWHMADRLAAQAPAVAGQANAVKAAVDDAVLGRKTRSSPEEDYGNARGLGIYWPKWVSGAYGDYVNHNIFTATRDGRWDDFLAGYFGRRPMERRGMPVNPPPVEKRSVHTLFLPLVLRSE